MRLILLALLATTLLTHARPGPSATFEVDSTQSTVTATGNAAGFAIQEQGPGSLVTKLTGTVSVELQENSIRFLNTTLVDPQVNGEWQPNTNGAAGFAPADFAGQANVFITTVKGAFRNITIGAKSDALPLANGSFDATKPIYFFPTNSNATFDYNAGFQLGSTSLAGMEGGSRSGTGTVRTQGNKQILEIPLDLEMKFSLQSTNDSVVYLIGKVVAVRDLPPPEMRITSITYNEPQVVITAVNVPAEAIIQVTSNLVGWNNVVSTRTDQPGVTEFRINSPAGAIGFFRIMTPGQP